MMLVCVAGKDVCKLGFRQKRRTGHGTSIPKNEALVVPLADVRGWPEKAWFWLETLCHSKYKPD